MPTYEYQCGKCGVFEVSQRMADAALTKCPTCRRKVQRLISASSFAFKGTGWYVTDYARKGEKKSGGGEGASTGDSGSSAGSSESKASETKSSSESKPAESKSATDTPKKTPSSSEK